MRLTKHFLYSTMFVGLFSIVFLSSGCSNSDVPEPSGDDKPVNEMVTKLASGELSGEFTKYISYFEEYDAQSGEWHDMGILYGGWPSSPDKFSIVGGNMYYEVLLTTNPAIGLWEIKDLWDAYQRVENKRIGLYVVKPFEVTAETLVFEDLHTRPAKITVAEDDKLTIILDEIIGNVNSDDGTIPQPSMHEVAQYSFTPGEAPDVTECKVFGSINEAYQYVIDCGRENWDQIKIYMPEEYRDGVDFDKLEKRIKNNTIIF